MSFPLSPTNGLQYRNLLGNLYQYYSADNEWRLVTMADPGGPTGLVGYTGLQGVTGHTYHGIASTFVPVSATTTGWTGMGIYCPTTTTTSFLNKSINATGDIFEVRNVAGYTGPVYHEILQSISPVSNLSPLVIRSVSGGLYNKTWYAPYMANGASYITFYGTSTLMQLYGGAWIYDYSTAATFREKYDTGTYPLYFGVLQTLADAQTSGYIISRDLPGTANDVTWYGPYIYQSSTNMCYYNSTTAKWFLYFYNNSRICTNPWVQFSTSTTGWSSGNIYVWTEKIGRTVYVMAYAAGTSNATTATFILPFAASNNIGTKVTCQIQDNTAFPENPGKIVIAAGSTTATVYKDCAENPWTSSGTKGFYTQFKYESNA